MTCWRFNWATSFQTWKCIRLAGTTLQPQVAFQLGHVFSDMEMRWGLSRFVLNREPVVSIGPRLFRHGNDKNFMDKGRWNVTMFQLGHVFSDMEIMEDRLDLLDTIIGVSIGPRLFRHGNAAIALHEPLADCSGVSIGPRLFRHGNRHIS